MSKQNQNVEIREATLEDALIIASAERKVAEIPGRIASLPHEIKDETLKEKISNLSTSKTGKFIVMLVNNQIIAHAYLDPLKLSVTAHVVDLTIVVHEGYQGKGYGKALLTHLIEWARTNPDIEKIMLHVRSSNQNAISLYQNLGFVTEGVRVKFIKIAPHTYLDNIAMALWVGP